MVLTEDGQRLALAILRRHRLTERFLTDVLRIPWDRVDGIADQMEHALPDEVVDALERMLGSPFTCPHGYPIPDRQGHIAPSGSVPTLADVPPGGDAKVVRVDEHVPGLLAYLAGLGVVPGARLQVVAANPLDETVTLRVAGSAGAPLVVGPRVARAVGVAVDDADGGPGAR